MLTRENKEIPLPKLDVRWEGEFSIVDILENTT